MKTIVNILIVGMSMYIGILIERVNQVPPPLADWQIHIGGSRIHCDSINMLSSEAVEFWANGVKTTIYAEGIEIYNLKD